LLAEGVEDAGQLVDRAVAGALAEDARRVSLPSGGDEAPAAGSPTRHGGVAAIARLERQGDVAALGGIDQGLAVHGERFRIGCLFVAREDDGEVQVFEGAGGPQRFEGVQDDYVATIHVGGADAAGRRVLAHEACACWPYHGVEVYNEQYARAPDLAAMLGVEVARAVESIGQRGPRRGET